MPSVYQERVARPCPDHVRPRRHYDYARQKHHTDYCERCGGNGHVYDVETVQLGSADPRQDKREAEARAMGMIQAMVKMQSFATPETYLDAKRIVAEWQYANERLSA